MNRPNSGPSQLPPEHENQPDNIVQTGYVNVEHNGFEKKKTQYFSNLALHLKEALKVHKAQGLWERNEAGERDWGNVTEHCLVEAARALEFADLLGLPDDLTEDLTTAAALHDFYKKGEKEITVTHGLRWESYDKANEQANEILQEASFPDRVIWLTESIGHSSLETTEHMLGKSELTPEEKAFLVLHYIDDYTVDSDWAEPSEAVEGKVINTLDKRIDMNEANARYKQLDEDGRDFFDSRTTFEAQREIGHLVEAKLADLVTAQTNQPMDPKELPILIDGLIRTRINASS